MSSFATSANQSTESGTSSMLRSGLSISVGDTKSIVLALQALQGKIRALERDRDYHQDQYERALQAHETYKLDMQRQAEQERAAHHKRERDLMDLLRKAQEKKTNLEATLGGRREDLTDFRRELEEMIATEKRTAQEREGKLTAEVTRLRNEVAEERAKHTALLASLDSIKAERRAVYETNLQLRQAMDELLSQSEQQQQRAQQRRRRGSVVGSGGRLSWRRPTPSYSDERRAVYAAPVRSPRRGRPASVARTMTVPLPRRSLSRYTFRDPTCNSILRDVRNVAGEVPCCSYPTTHSSLLDTENHDPLQPAATHRPPPPLPTTTTSSHNNNSNDNQASTATAAVARGGATSSAAANAPQALSSSSSSAVDRASPRGGKTVSQHRNALDQVTSQLQSELAELQTQYKDTIRRASVENIASDVLTGTLHRIASLIDHKEEQLRLMKEAHRELESAVGGQVSLRVGDPAAGGSVLSEKATQRSLFMNELRSMLSESRDK